MPFRAVGAEISCNCQTEEITIHHLPDEILAKIFYYLKVEHIAYGVQHVCERWAYVSQVSDVWKNKIYSPSPFTALDSIISVIEQSPMIEGVDISRFISVRYLRAILKSLVSSVRNLKFLALRANSSINSPVRDVILALRNTLVCLKIQFCDSSPFDVPQDYYADILIRVGMCSNLKSLIIAGVIICHTSAFEAIANGCVSLKTLNIERCEIIESNALESLLKRKVDSIVSLSLPWNVRNDKGTLPLVAKYCKKIEKLSVSISSTVFGITVTHYDMAALKDMPFLTELSLPSLKHDVLNPFLDLLESNVFQNLVKLNLKHNTWMKNIAFEAICAKCPKLKYLNLQSCYELTSSAFRMIYLLKCLEYLNLKGCRGLRNDVVVHIVKCKMLRYLNVEHIVIYSRDSLKLCCENLNLLEELHMQVSRVSKDEVLFIPNRLKIFFLFEVETQRTNRKGNCYENFY